MFSLKTAFQIALALLKLSQSIFRYLERQNYIDEGRDQIIMEQSHDMYKLVKRVRAARAADSLPEQDDPDNRDRDGEQSG